ncbi:MAG: hypothetical protein DRI37_04645 [Chloroflexi bacterium]|nr:MAG: hypothetical protein DRI37_04645 [Chloroflexota bacterium]
MRKWTLSEYWRIKAWLLPIAFLIIFLWVYFGCPEIFGKLGFQLMLGTIFGVLYFSIICYLKRKEAKKMRELKKLDNKRLDDDTKKTL